VFGKDGKVNSDKVETQEVKSDKKNPPREGPPGDIVQHRRSSQ
jgi:hypothetical protein